MIFCIITNVSHIKDKQCFAYSPYVREINIWLQFVDEAIIVAPLEKKEKTAIDIAYEHDKIVFKKVPAFDITSVKQLIKTLFLLPILFCTIFKAIKQADHIHLRCPGNIGLIGALVQIAFPKKKKTAKYAGNWDPKAKQPWSYRLQKWILSNTFLTRNMQVLVYGKWENQSKNIKPFFTATYSQSEIQNLEFRIQNSEFKNGIKFLFVGTLSPGKQPLYALQLMHELVKKGYNTTIDFYGEGNQRAVLEDYIHTNNLEKVAVLKGNQTKDEVTKAYKNSHFSMLPSKSEGWPKAVAEAMFWNCLPIATKISCVPYMLDYGHRGILLEEHLNKDVLQIQNILEDENEYQTMSQNAQVWSREYTLEFFEAEIKKLLL
jgi:glycosyltransferase involved in cell wall biosynthesis